MQAGGIRIIEYCEMRQPFQIWNISDPHMFNVACAMDLLDNDIKEIERDPFSFWVLNGDYCDWIDPADKRFDASILGDMPAKNLSDYGQKCIDYTASKFECIADKCFAMGLGNHEYKYMLRHNQLGLHSALCETLKCTNLLYSGFFDVYFVENKRAKKPIYTKRGIIPKKFCRKLRVMTHHGAGAAATAGGKINMLARMVGNVQADLVMLGHVHEALAKPFVKLTTNESCNKLKSKITMGMISGTYLKCYEEDVVTYGEMKGYNPTTLGASKATYIPSIGRLSIETVAQDIGDRQ